MWMLFSKTTPLTLTISGVIHPTIISSSSIDLYAHYEKTGCCILSETGKNLFPSIKLDSIRNGKPVTEAHLYLRIVKHYRFVLHAPLGVCTLNPCTGRIVRVIANTTDMLPYDNLSVKINTYFSLPCLSGPVERGAKCRPNRSSRAAPVTVACPLLFGSKISGCSAPVIPL